MKRIYIMLLIIFTSQIVWAQSTPDSNLTKKYLLNFSIPDNPAFNALGTNPSNILRPSDIQKFSAMLAPFYSSGTAVIPKNFALEFAPWKLASQNWSLAHYRAGINSFLYNSAFSIGTIRDTGTFASKLSLGYRFSIQSKNGDILRGGFNDIIEYQTNTIRVSKEMKDAWLGRQGQDLRHRDAADEFFKKNVDKFNSFIDSINNNKLIIKKDTHLVRLFHDYKKYKGRPDFSGISTSIDSLISIYKKEYWNAGRFDFAMAWVGESSDTLAKNTRFSSFNAWMTGSIRFGNSGQLLVGGSIVMPRSEKTLVNDTIRDTTKMKFTVNLRFYEGTSDVRGFIESQYKYQNYGGTSVEKSVLFNLGAEFRMGAFWVIASTGVNNYLTEKNPVSKLEANLDLRYSINK